MSRLRPDSATTTVAVEVEGRVVNVPAGASVAAALLMSDLDSGRDSAISGAARSPYCMIGVCFDCLVEIDGQPNRQGCMVAVQRGMRIRRQRGARAPFDGE
jgi:D-hydroxyproline dehydrogenase subunit gamma